MPSPAIAVRARSRALAAVLAAGLALSGCAGAGTGAGTAAGTAAEPGDDPRPLVLTTFTVLADMARSVAGDALRVESLTKPGAEIHGYEPTPGDLVRAAGADLIIDNGLHLEAWFEQFVEDLDVPHIVASAGVEPIRLAEGAVNPHAWMSPLAAETYVDNLVAAFSRLAPEHAEAFEARGAEYRAELRGIADELAQAISAVPPAARVLVTCEGAFSYLARDLGLAEAYIWPVNAEQQATPRRIAAVIDTVRERDVPAVFCESTVSDRPMQRVVDSSDAAYGGVLYVDSLSEPDGPVPTYLDLLRVDAERIMAGLAGRAA